MSEPLIEFAFEDALAAGKEILGKMRAEDFERTQKRYQDEKQQLEAERQSVVGAMTNLLPGYVLDAFAYDNSAEEMSSKNNRTTICLEREGFAPIKCYFSKVDPRIPRGEWMLEGFRVAEVEVATDFYKHLGDPPVSGPAQVKCQFIQEKNFFKETGQFPLALAISAENGEMFSKISWQIEDLKAKEAAHWEEQRRIVVMDENKRVLTLEEMLLESLRQFINKAVR